MTSKKAKATAYLDRIFASFFENRLRTPLTNVLKEDKMVDLNHDAPPSYTKPSMPKEGPKPAAETTAATLLGTAKELLEQRARDYDKPGGERSMGKVAAMFNLATEREGDRAMSESEAWLVMALLKIVRDRSTVGGHQDSCEDLVSYSGLYGEARLRELRARTEAVQAKVDAAYGVKIVNVDTANMTGADMEKAVLDAVKTAQAKQKPTVGSSEWNFENKTRAESSRLAVKHMDRFGRAATVALIRKHGGKKLHDLSAQGMLNFIKEVVVALAASDMDL